MKLLLLFYQEKHTFSLKNCRFWHKSCHYIRKISIFAPRKRFQNEQFKNYKHQKPFQKTGGTYPQNWRSEVFVD